MSVNNRILELMKEQNVSKASLAKISGIPYTTLDSMLKRETDTKRLSVFFRIAKALGTSVEALVFEEDEPELSVEQKRILELYSLLDERGKDTVLSILEKEADNSEKPLRTLPVYASPAAAGAALPILTEELTELEYREGEIPDDVDFGIRISGDSMTPLFSDGDLAYVKKTRSIASGQIGIFVLNGESLCKKMQYENGKTCLVSLNEAYAPIPILDTDDLMVVGVVKN